MAWFKLECAMNALKMCIAGIFLLLNCVRADAASITTPVNTGVTSATSQIHTIVFVGDSITEGYGVKQEQAYPAIAGELLKKRGKEVKIVNGGISGSVSADADARVKWFLKLKPEILVLELGGNDALKGTPAKQIEKNLDQALKVADDAHLKVLLAGMRVFTNFGPEYSKQFADIFPRLAKAHHAALIPFLLEDVAMKPGLMQADQKHPNVEGHARVAVRVADALEKML